MNDIIMPSGFDLTKNLHGHVRVETRSRWTGKVIDSQEKDNLVTNAIQKLVYANAWVTVGLSSWFAPIYEKALGSLVLFGDTLTENANNIFFPNKPPIAIAPYAANADADGGSLNTSESGFTSDGYTNVWDFTTSQANGTIAALARSFHLLRNGFLISTAANMDLGIAGRTFAAMYFLGYDETNKYLFVAPFVSATINGVSFDTKGIYKVKKDLEKIDLENSSLVFQRASLIKTLSSSDGTTTARYFMYDRWKNEFVYMTGSTLHKIAMDGTHTSSTISGTGSYANFSITENYYWRSGGSSSTKVYRISKTNLADVVEYTVADSGVYPMSVYGNDVAAAGAGGNFGTHSILYPDGTIVRKTGQTQASVSNGGMPEVGMYFGGSYSNTNQMMRRANYLGTIANLDSPVTKTSSQTMKITYTLTEA